MKTLFLFMVSFLFILGSSHAQTMKSIDFRSEDAAFGADRDHIAVYKVSDNEFYMILVKDESNSRAAKRTAAAIIKPFWRQHKNLTKSERFQKATELAVQGVMTSELLPDAYMQANILKEN